MRFLNWLWSTLGGPKAPAPAFITKAQAETIRLCGFLPAASTVASIVGAMTGQGAVAASAVGVATTVCKAVSASRVNRLVETPVPIFIEVEGVEILVEGEFVGK